MEVTSRTKKTNKHAFSVELASKKCVTLVAMPNDVENSVLIEGFLGELKSVNLIEGALLEIKAANGTLRVDLKEEELSHLINKGGQTA